MVQQLEWIYKQYVFHRIPLGRSQCPVFPEEYLVA